MSYAAIDDLRLYYETRGTGEPLVLLHGGGGAVEMFAGAVPALSRRRQVITVDLQAHGRTADIDRPLRFESLADDVAALLGQLGHDTADVLGYSLGGGTALRLAIQHPDLVRRLVLVSTPYARSGWFPEVLANMDQLGPETAEQMKQSPIYELYARVAPRVEDWPELWRKTGELLRQDYDWAAEIPKITAEPMLVYGDADSVTPDHIVAFYRLFGGGLRDAGWDGSGRSAARLAVLPGVTHYDIVTSRQLWSVATPFLTGEAGAAPAGAATATEPSGVDQAPETD